MTLKELEQVRRGWLDRNVPYKLLHWTEFDFDILQNIIYRNRPGRTDGETYNDAIIMADTETSKKPFPYRKARRRDGDAVFENLVYENHVVAWSISVRAFGRNIVTLWGQRPSDFCQCIATMLNRMRGDRTIVYFHNLAYDYVFLRKFLFLAFGEPVDQLNTKPHYPLQLIFENGLILRDSLILAQRSIERWAKDLNVEHQKAVGMWDYDKLRNQSDELTADELEYIEHDTLAGVECLDAIRKALNKNVHSMPYTATGIPREDVRKRGRENRGRDFFRRNVLPFDLYIICEQVYHGGYTHANRHEIGFIHEAECFDFASSYPYVMLSEKYPMHPFTALDNKSIDFILENAEQYAFMFRLRMFRPELKSDSIPMPALQFSKCTLSYNAIVDNGRILKADYAEIWLNEIDLKVIVEQYTWAKHLCTDVHAATKDYLPRYLTDYVMQLYRDKTVLKGGDPILYALAKSKLNSVYGMCVQKSIRDNLHENFETGEYEKDTSLTPEDQYERYMKNNNNVLLYQWGVWVTSYAFYNLFQLGKCVAPDGLWLYSDTDSCYASKWDYDAIGEYNAQCREKLEKNGYSGVFHNGREYWPGAAESDGKYTEFVTLGAKRYCGRSEKDGALHITVAGVPKKGAKVLNDDIKNFRKGLIFPGEETGKLTHTYIYKDGIYVDEAGNETGDSIDLSPCAYLLDSVNRVTWTDLDFSEVQITYYEEGDFTS